MGVAVENSGKSKASSFIIELLQVGVNGLFSLHVDDVSQDQEAVRKFDRDLRNFIAKNLPKDRLLFLIKQMMVSWICTLPITLTHPTLSTLCPF